MNYNANKRRKTQAVLDLLILWAVLLVLVGALGQSCVVAVDKHQQQFELPLEDRQAVVATWTE